MDKLLKLTGLAVLVVGLAVGVMMAQRQQRMGSKAATSTYTYNTDLLALRYLYNQKVSTYGIAATQTTTVLNSMISLASSRKSYLLNEIGSNASQFLTHATLASQRSTFPKDVQAYIEEDTSLSGSWGILSIDNFSMKKYSRLYSLQTSDGKVFDIYPVETPKMTSGSMVSVRGVRLDISVGVPSGQLTTVKAAALNVTGDHKTAVILATLLNIVPEPAYTETMARALIFSSDMPSVNSYYKDASSNSLSFSSGDLYNWVTLGRNAGPGGEICPIGLTITNGWLSEYIIAAQSAANAAYGFNANNYDHVVVVLSAKCDGVFGAAYSPLKSLVVFKGGESFPEVYIHEMGHLLGLAHANSLNCGNPPKTDLSKCVSEVYGDLYTQMGGNEDYSQTGSNAPNRLGLGWISPLSVTAPGTYTVKALEGGGSPRILRISKPDTGQFYYVSYRQRQTFYTSGLPLSMVGGVSIHLWDGVTSSETNLVNTHPPGQVAFSALADGETFYDAINKISIRQVSHTSTSVIVSIDTAALPATITPPAINPVVYQYLGPTPGTGDCGAICQYDTDCTGGLSCAGYLNPPICWNNDAVQRCGLDSCPYSSTQAQVQKSSSDPWGDAKSITLGQPVRFGGFHNANGYFANPADVDFFITPPTGVTLTSPVLYPYYPINFTPAKPGIYKFVGRTRDPSGEYFPADQLGCTDSGSVVVVTPTPTTVPPVCNSYESIYINSCNTAAKWSGTTPALRDPACKTLNQAVTLHISGGTATSMRFYEPPPSDNLLFCSDFSDASFSAPEVIAGTRSWTVQSGVTDPTTDPGKKRVCIGLKNNDNPTWAKCAGQIQLLPSPPTATPTPYVNVYVKNPAGVAVTVPELGVHSTTTSSGLVGGNCAGVSQCSVPINLSYTSNGGYIRFTPANLVWLGTTPGVAGGSGGSWLAGGNEYWDHKWTNWSTGGRSVTFVVASPTPVPTCGLSSSSGSSLLTVGQSTTWLVYVNSESGGTVSSVNFKGNNTLVATALPLTDNTRENVNQFLTVITGQGAGTTTLTGYGVINGVERCSTPIGITVVLPTPTPTPVPVLCALSGQSCLKLKCCAGLPCVGGVCYSGVNL